MGVSRLKSPFIPLDMAKYSSGDSDKNVSSTFPSYPSVFSRSDLFDLDAFTSVDEPIMKDIIDEIAKNDRLPNSLQLTEPTSIDAILDNEVVESDKFRFVIKSSELKRAMANKDALKVKQVTSTVRGDIDNDPTNLNEILLNPSILELLSQADVEESESKIVYRIEVNESELRDIISDEGSPMNEDLVEKSKSKAVFYGDSSNKQSWDKAKKYDKKQRSYLPVSSSWFFLLSKKELFADMLGSLIVSSGFLAAIVFMDAVSSVVHMILKKIFTFRKNSFNFVKNFPIISMLTITFYLSKYVRNYYKERKFDGIGYKVSEK